MVFEMIARKIVHIDMDAFYASVEQRDDPQLRGKPVVVACVGIARWCALLRMKREGSASVPPCPLFVPNVCALYATFLPPDFPRYRAVSRQVREIFKRHTDLIEPLSLDEAYLDVSENKTGLPTATQVARTIREQIRSELSLTASAGVAPNKFLAKIARTGKNRMGSLSYNRKKSIRFYCPLPVEPPARSRQSHGRKTEAP